MRGEERKTKHGVGRKRERVDGEETNGECRERCAKGKEDKWAGVGAGEGKTGGRRRRGKGEGAAARQEEEAAR